MKNEEIDELDEGNEFISDDVEELTFSGDENADVENGEKTSIPKYFLFLPNEITAIIFTVLIVVIATGFCVFSALAETGDSNLTIKRYAENNEYSLMIELNTAAKVRFELIPGIGAVMADKIVKYRKNVK